MSQAQRVVLDPTHSDRDVPATRRWYNPKSEAHSADDQSTDALAALVKDHFFLKVGPELIFRFREAVWALSTSGASGSLLQTVDSSWM